MKPLTVIGAILILISLAGMGAMVDWSDVFSDQSIVDVVPEVKPAPINDSGFNVLIVEETEHRHKLPAYHKAIIGSIRLRQWVEEKGGELRIEDSEDPLTYSEDKWKNAMLNERSSVPWVYANNGDIGISEPLPESVDALIAKLEVLIDG